MTLDSQGQPSNSEFQSLIDELSELDTLRKARTASAEPKRKPEPEPEPEEDEEPDSEEYEDEDEDDEDQPRKPFGKSFGVTLPDGSQVEAMDGTAVLASLQSDVAALGADLHKALRTLVSLTKSQAADLDAQRTAHAAEVADLRKSYASDLHALREEVAALARQPKGRKSVLDVHEPPAAQDLNVGTDSRLDGPAILAKASTMNLDPVTMAVLCELVNTKQPLPPNLAKAFQ